ncbi:uncharacterized protein LOC113312466 [Papaver somniferum]|uniref:uncharacterized protein LOC113312466 n=1 Tax=Papaver somniferum TaxID=3469 RepID=UPI000E6F66DF|nr:uncharacterized protein LOC113312466 [Papaver somniferum]
MAAIHLDGKAGKWFENFRLNKYHISWPELSENICSRFENPAHDNIVGIFNKLSQLTTVEAYFEEFEYYKALLLSVHKDFPESYFIASFIGGLKEELRNSILMFESKTLMNAFSLARMQEQTLLLQHKTHKPTTRNFSPSFSTSRPFPPTTLPPKPTYIPPTSSTTQPIPKPSPPLPFKKLTPEQVQAIKAQGLCFNCDETYRRGHVCKKQYLCVLIGEETEEIFDSGLDTERETDEEPLVESNMGISLNAFTDTTSADTIRIPGFVKKKIISVLIDTGSTHRFIDSNLAKSLQCSVEKTASLLVTVANGDKTVSSGICSQLEWSMQGHKFCGDLRPPPLGGCDIVLGADWLRNLGDVLFNLAKLCITFKHKGKKITLQGTTTKPSLHMMSGSAIKKDLDHKIPLQPNSVPVNLRPYKCPYIQKSVVEQLVQDMLLSGIIQPNNNPFASPILLVKKKDNSWRFCVDYRKLNNITIKDKFPIPVIDELLDELHGSKFFTKIDLKSGYHQIRVYPSDVHTTAFRTHHGHFEFKVMPFCLTNAPATFQALMNKIFQPHLRKFILVFFDDILIYSPSLEDHVLHLQITLQILRENQLFANFSKCCFGQSELEYLGHIVTANGVKADPAKISAMVDWPIPTTIKALRGFLGLTGYYKKFVKDYGLLCRPLTDLLKRNSFHWSPAATTAFIQLKSAMSTTPVLALPDFTKQFMLETDACDVGISDVLVQENRAIAFYSKPLGPKVAAMFTYEKELLAIFQVVTRWKHYLQAWTQDIIDNYDDDSTVQNLIAQLTLTPSSNLKYTYLNGILRYKERLYIGSSTSTRTKILDSIHSSAVGRHSGMQATYIRAKSYFYWPAMKKDILLFVSTCDVCQRHKGEHTFPAGLLQPLPIPDHAWQHISMDFIEGLPMSERKSIILFVVDRLTKYIHFIGLHHPYTAASVAREFLSNVFKLHGLPASIVYGETKSSQTDGQTERVNYCLEIYLRCMCSHQQKKWHLWLPLDEWWYNTNYHTRLKMSPFQPLYGYLPPHLAFPSSATTSVAAVDDYMKQRAVVIDLLKETLHKSQERMKFFADKTRIDRVFEVGNKVYLKLQPYRQASVDLRRNLKLATKYYGPFSIIQKIGAAAYKLQLLA